MSEAEGTPPSSSERPSGTRFERTQLGGTDPTMDRRRQRQSRDEEFRAPLTSSDMVKGPTEFAAEDSRPRVNWTVLIVASAVDSPDDQSTSAPLRRNSLLPDRTASGRRAGACLQPRAVVQVWRLIAAGIAPPVQGWGRLLASP